MRVPCKLAVGQVGRQGAAHIIRQPCSVLHRLSRRRRSVDDPALQPSWHDSDGAPPYSNLGSDCALELSNPSYLDEYRRLFNVCPGTLDLKLYGAAQLPQPRVDKYVASSLGM